MDYENPETLDTETETETENTNYENFIMHNIMAPEISALQPSCGRVFLKKTENVNFYLNNEVIGD